MARRAGWTLEAAPDDSVLHEDVVEYRWKVADTAMITLVKNLALDRPYLVVSGPDPDDLIASVSRLIPSYTVADIMERLAVVDSTEEKLEALQLVAAVGLHDYRKDLYDALVTLMGDQNARVRVAALFAGFQLNWKQLRPMVEQIHASDEDSDLRALSGSLLRLTDWSAG